MGLGTETLGGHIILHVICGCFTAVTRGRRKKVVILIFQFSAYKVEKAFLVKIGIWLEKMQNCQVILLAISGKIWV